MAVMAAPVMPPPKAGERAAEHHAVANSVRSAALADQFEIPERVGDIADQHRAESAVRRDTTSFL